MSFIPNIPTPSTPPPVAGWRYVLAFLIDLILSFVVFGRIIAWATGDLTENGFSLSGPPAIVMLVAIIAYLVLGARLGIRIGWRLLGIRR